MLRAMLSDFRAWGRFPIVTTLDRRLADVSLPADQVVVIDPMTYPTPLIRLAKQCAGAVIIAPESGGTLEHFSAIIEDSGALLLGSRPEGVAVAADKWECHRRFVQEGLPTPATVRTTWTSVLSDARELGFPLVVKPINGAGCEGVALASSGETLEQVLVQPALCQASSFLLQRHVAGTPASVSLLIAEGNSVALSLNEQCLRRGIPFEYAGGIACISHDHSTQALDLARRAVGLVPGLQGYVGVDLVLNDSGCSLIEINPRLTTSYVGIRRVISNINLAEAIWHACTEAVLPEVIVAKGEAPFEKEDLDDL